MINILIAGDFSPRRRLEKLILEKRYSEIFAEVKQHTSLVDYSIVNFETTVISGEGTPIKKTGPNLKCSKNAIEAIKYAGFDCVALANNHFYDYGDEGVKDTLITCKENNIDYVGGGENITEAEKILYKKIKGKIFAFINFCESEWSIATLKSGGAAPLNPIHNFHQIRNARELADYVIVIVHGGVEEYELPTPRMKETYRFFVDAGADAVINHHQHCFSGYEIYNNKPIFYGLGNFCFDWVTQSVGWWEEGFIVVLEFSNQIGFSIHPYVQCHKEASVIFMKDTSLFDEKIARLNSIIGDDDRLGECFNNIAISKYSRYSDLLEPYSNRYFKFLYSKNLLPSLVSVKQKKILLNMVRCESHRDLLMKVLQESYSGLEK